MTYKRSNGAFFQKQKKNGFTHFMSGSEKWLRRIGYLLAAVLIAIVVGGINLHANAEEMDWHDNAASSQIQQQARAEARKLWREENGDFQPNLTPAAEKELRLYVATKQAEIDRTLQENAQ